MKIKNRIFLSIFFCSFAALILAVTLVTRIMYSAMINEVQTEIKNEAEYISSALNIFEDDPRLPDYISENGGRPENRITLCGSDGTVLYDNYADTDSLENHLDRPEIAQAAENGTGFSLRSSHTLGEHTFYYAVRLENGNILRIAATGKNAVGLLGNSLVRIILIAIVIIAISAAAADFLTKTIIRPINSLDLDRPIDNDTYEELSPLLSRMNRQNREIAGQMEKLSRQKNELSCVMDNMSEGIVLFDSQGNILSANPAAERIFHTSGAGKYMQLCRAEEYTDTVEAALAGEKSSAKFERDGQIYRLTASSVDGSGAVLFVINITEQETAEQMRREFSANVSHELKTPLTSVMGAAELIETGLARQEDIPRFAGRIRSEASRLLALIEDIIKISRLDEYDLKDEFERVSLDEICKSVVSDLTGKAVAMGISLKYSAAECTVNSAENLSSDVYSTEISGIKPVLYEMIRNLCDNGIIYNKKGGYVNITLKKDNGHCILTVSDNGIGIPQRHQERIFERFYRVDKSRSRERGGTGLGLSIVKHGALLHNAEIKLESRINSGTRVTLLFPLS